MLVGCETSSTYSSTSRVVDATSNSSSAVQTSPYSGGASRATAAQMTTVSDMAVPQSAYPSSGTTGGTVTLGSISDEPLPGAPSAPSAPGAPVSSDVSQQVAYDMQPAPAGSLIGGVPDEPIMMPPATTTTTTSSSSVATPSSSTGNWLLVDSEEAQIDETTTDAQLLASARATPNPNQVLDSSSATVYQNKISTTAGPDKYRVVKGDTLYSIAFRYGLDYHALANINKIAPPYNLSVGQVLLLNLKAQKAPEYVVKKGDTLYSIARKNNQSVSVLASVNNLEPPYNLKIGQKILLSRDNAVTAANSKENGEVPVAGNAAKGNTTASTNTSGSKTTASTSTSRPANTTANSSKPVIINTASRKVSGVTWSWPTTTGRVIEQFSTSEQGNKGIDISGQRGQAIYSAADGQVVYAGNALRGFGNLIIINHTNEYLSAYAHNEALLVKEGQKVKRGQQIARMGNTDASSVRLHFEIRYRGQSVNPISYLPK